MLGKLVKHEMRAMLRILPLAFIPAVFFAIVLKIAQISRAEVPVIIFGSVVSFLGFAIMYFTLAYCVVRFYKSVYGAEGYLTMTLPVAEEHVYNSRAITGLICLTVSSIAMTLCYSYGMSSIMTLFPMTYEETLTMNMVFGKGMISFIFLSSFLGNVAALLELYLCVTIAHVKPFRKLGLGSAVLSYIAIYTIGQIIMTPLTLFVPLSIAYTKDIGWQLANTSMWSSFSGVFELSNHSVEASMEAFPIGIAGFIWPVVSIIVCPFITTKLMRTKVNLK